VAGQEHLTNLRNACQRSILKRLTHAKCLAKFFVILYPPRKGTTMPIINPYIVFNGNAEEAFNFYKSVFGGEFAMVKRFCEMSSPGFPVAAKDANKVAHIALPIGKNILMANDVPEVLGVVAENENRSKISISAESRAEADRIFNGLSRGGSIEMPMADSPWGSYFGMFRDKFGIEWMVDFDPKFN
jgi:PhnB protein